VLSAIIAPALLLDNSGSLAIRADNSYLLAGIITVVVAWRSRNVLITTVIGMTALWILKALKGDFAG
jgi:branched-subunit amino acid transport protein